MKTQSRFVYSSLNDVPLSQVAGKPELRLTMPYTKGGAVRDLQSLLVQAGYPMSPYGVDGVFGPATRSAVRQFQARAGLPVTGVVSVETWAALQTATQNGVPGSPGDTYTSPGYQDPGTQGQQTDAGYTLKTWALIGTAVVIGGAALSKMKD